MSDIGFEGVPAAAKVSKSIKWDARKLIAIIKTAEQFKNADKLRDALGCLARPVRGCRFRRAD